MSPATLAARLHGNQAGFSRSAEARRIRRIARRLFSDKAPGKGGQWDINETMARLIENEINRYG